MKYENKELVKEIVSQIETLSEEKEKIDCARDGGELHVVIKKCNNNYSLSTIGVGDFEHRYTIYANDFISRVLEDLHLRIGALKTKLKDL